MYCKNCDQPLESTEFESKISDHATEVIKTLMSLYVAGFGFYFTLAAIYFAYRSSSTADAEDVDLLRIFMIVMSLIMGLVTVVFRFVVEKAFIMYQRNMLVVAGLQNNTLFDGAIQNLIRFGKIGASAVYLLLGGAIVAIYYV